MTHMIFLPLNDDGVKTEYVLSEPKNFPRHTMLFRSRIAFAAAHVVAASPTTVNWDATLAYRRHLWSHGFAVAEAMDTAQRGMGLDWLMAQELIRHSIAEAAACGGVVASGAGTDHLMPQPARSVRRAGRLCRIAWQPCDFDGQPRTGGVRTWAEGLCARIRAYFVAGAAAGDRALARRYV
jgi:hypothetical protein